MHSASAQAPVNIATLKYWGKRDAQLNLPTNSSISVTLSPEDMCAHTTAQCGPEVDEDVLILNGAPEKIGARTAQVLSGLRRERAALEGAQPDLEKISQFKLRITSNNNFPTAAGLASSAAGFAALVKAVALLYALPLDESALSVYARQGSGSACRSLFGGYVAWEMGSKPDGSDSKAVQLAPEAHWPEMRALILVACGAPKDVPSTSGMQRTVATSTLFKERVKNVVPQRYVEFCKAIEARDFAAFARLTMIDSNQFHAVCLDSEPPIFYLNDASRAAIKAVEAVNADGVVAAYTFDAGPNCVVYYEEKNEQKVLEGLSCLSGVQGWPGAAAAGPTPTPTAGEGAGASAPTVRPFEVALQKGIERVIKTRVGQGAREAKALSS